MKGWSGWRAASCGLYRAVQAGNAERRNKVIPEPPEERRAEGRGADGGVVERRQTVRTDRRRGRITSVAASRVASEQVNVAG